MHQWVQTIPLANTTSLCRYFNEIAQYVLDCLHVATLQPQARHAVLATRTGGRSGMAVILTAAGGHPFMMDAEVSQPSQRAHDALASACQLDDQSPGSG